MKNEERINVLGNQVRTLKRIVCGFGCLLTVGVVVGTTSMQKVPDVIEAKTFRVVNDDGLGLVILSSMQVEGRDDFAHIAILDHPTNGGSPPAWRVDGQFGVGPSRAIMGDWTIKQGTSESIKHQIVVYTGKLRDLELTN